MENKIFDLEHGTWKSIVLTADECWLSERRMKSLEKFETAVRKSGLFNKSECVPLSAITEVSFNEASEYLKVKYRDAKQGQKKLNLGFEDKGQATQFGHFLGEKLSFSKTEKVESQLKPLLLNAFYLIVAVGGTIFLATLEDASELSGGETRRSRGNRAMLRLVVEILGQTGVIIVGSLISAIIAYRLYKRFVNPANEILYRG